MQLIETLTRTAEERCSFYHFYLIAFPFSKYRLVWSWMTVYSKIDWRIAITMKPLFNRPGALFFKPSAVVAFYFRIDQSFELINFIDEKIRKITHSYNPRRRCQIEVLRKVGFSGDDTV